ncbi:probable xyloglucan galactosyltransferase GT14 [Coffea eugenioides]|uniref:probable xyloglucan galactosyltransferase GT14 n=1 Tax=Coffea eugenioides TaxID=49369 RepID=UPI000F615059|nr:probable xyloglucan galactosyltransferase GT14 [Coffea eugenioides]
MGKSTVGGKSRNKELLYVFMTWLVFCTLMLSGHYSSLIDLTMSSTPFPISGKSTFSLPTKSLFPIRKTKENLPDGKRDGVLDSCSGRYIYIHDLPSRFNVDIIKNCNSSLIKWFDMCKCVMNGGFGPAASNSRDILQEHSWYATDQFSLEVIFHNRMKKYQCLTNESSLASAIYVPFYAGHDVSRYLWESNISARDAAGVDFSDWINKQPEWKTMWGKDHFFVAGRIIWDFRRETNKSSGWGNNLMLLSEVKNMTVLTIESIPWSPTDIAIPYPTYFHPTCQEEVEAWQKKIKQQKRPYLYSFVGAPRPNTQGSIRGRIIEQCLDSREKCKLLNCNISSNDCYDPGRVMEIFLNSRFCLQPTGDSYTRRSTFDSILGGCIPVFFNPGGAYGQYVSYLPKNHSDYSVFIPESDIREGKTSIEEVLRKKSEQEVVKMQEEVIKLIPKVIYVDPSSGLNTSEDAFDISIKKVLERVNTTRRGMKTV